MVNLMKIRTFIAALILSFGLAGVALADTGEVISKAYEVSLENFRAPATQNGSVSFKECDSCKMQLVRVTEGTRYFVNDKPVRLDDFRKAVSVVSDRASKTVIVMHHLESDTVVSVSVSL